MASHKAEAICLHFKLFDVEHLFEISRKFTNLWNLATVQVPETSKSFQTFISRDNGDVTSWE